MAREPHVNAVGFAGIQIQEFQNILLAAKQVQQEVLGLVVAAVGEQPATESGQNALAFTAAMGDQLDEMTGVCETVKAELNRYGGGF